MCAVLQYVSSMLFTFAQNDSLAPRPDHLTRAFQCELNAMSKLAGAARDAEIGVAITRLPDEDVRKMPPELLKTLTEAQIQTIITYLCSQTTTPIPQCAVL